MPYSASTVKTQNMSSAVMLLILVALFATELPDITEFPDIADNFNILFIISAFIVATTYIAKTYINWRDTYDRNNRAEDAKHAEAANRAKDDERAKAAQVQKAQAEMDAWYVEKTW